MKTIVLHLRDRSLKIDEEFFTQYLVKPLFLFFIYFGLYSRTEGIFGISGGKVSVLITFALFSISAFHFVFINKKNSISHFTAFISIFFVISGVMPLLSHFAFDLNSMRIIRFCVEIAINFIMFFSIYYFIREQLISPKYFIYSLGVLGVIAALLLLSNMIGEVRIRRLRGLGGSNYLANSFAMGAFAWVLIIYNYVNVPNQKLRKRLNYACFIIVVVTLLLTGTRASSIAFFCGIIAFQFFGMKSKKFTKYFIFTILSILAVILIISFNIDLSLLWERYTIPKIIGMAKIRFEIYTSSVLDLTLTEFLFGRPDLYLFGEATSLERIINPHNIFLGIVRFNGLIPFILFVAIFLMILYKYFVLYFIHKDRTEFRVMESSIIVLLIIVMFYALLSGGRFTRSFAFYIVLGYAVGYFELLKNLKNEQEYKRLIF